MGGAKKGGWKRARQTGNGAPVNQNQTINVPVTVNVNGMDATSAHQLGEIAAGEIIPRVEAAINGAATQYKK